MGETKEDHEMYGFDRERKRLQDEALERLHRPVVRSQGMLANPSPKVVRDVAAELLKEVEREGEDIAELVRRRNQK